MPRINFINAIYFIIPVIFSGYSNFFFISAEPDINVTQPLYQQVELPSAKSEVSTHLQCAIQPGALQQRYAVEWKLIYPEGNNHTLYTEFNPIINVTLNMEDYKYQCEVTINHDGRRNQTYKWITQIKIVLSGKEKLETSNWFLYFVHAGTSIIFYVACVFIFNVMKLDILVFGNKIRIIIMNLHPLHRNYRDTDITYNANEEVVVQKQYLPTHMSAK